MFQLVETIHYPDIKNHEFIILYLFSKGPTPASVVRKALLSWRGKPERRGYYWQYFTYDSPWSGEGTNTFTRCGRGQLDRMYWWRNGNCLQLTTHGEAVVDYVCEKIKKHNEQKSAAFTRRDD